MKLFRIKTLQKQMIVFLLLPVGVLLLGTGLAGFLYVRKVMLEQWRESALLRLERAAHYIDMRLARPLETIELMTKAQNSWYRQLIFQRLSELPGVVNAELKWVGENGRRTGHHMMMRFNRRGKTMLAPPVFDADSGTRTVSMLTSLMDSSGRSIAELELKLAFDYLMADILRLGWWQTEKACLVDKSGNYIVHTSAAMTGRRKLGDTGDSLEKKLLTEISLRSTGTVMGKGRPPDQVAGYHSLSSAPWTIILFAPGRQVLAPIVRFRNYYFSGAVALLLVILLLIRFKVGQMVGSIELLSKSAQQVARGDYGKPIPRRSDDELGILIDNYNLMVEGLKERDRIRNTFGLYIDEDVARELLQQQGAVRLGGDKRQVVILMADLRGFTTMAETLSPEDTISLLNRYFGYMIREIKVHRGIIVDFVGDGLLVFFDPVGQSIQQVALRAACCSLEMQAAIEQLNRSLGKEGLPAVTMGVGIHTGQVVVGNIGSQSRVKYGIVGAAVNFTQRIQAKAASGQVLASMQFVRLMQDKLVTGKPFSTILKGIQKEVVLYPIEEVSNKNSDRPAISAG